MSHNPYAPPSADLGSGAPGELAGGRGDFDIGTCLSDAWALTWRHLPLWLATALVWSAAAFLSVLSVVGIVLLMPVLSWGLVRFGLRMYDGDPAFGDAFSGFSRYGRALAPMLVLMVLLLAIAFAFQLPQLAGELTGSGALAAAGAILSFAAGLVLLPRLNFAYFYVVDRELPAVDAIQRSWQVTARPKWKVVGLLLLSYAVTMLGLLVLIIGVIPASAMSALMWVSAYRQMAGGPVAAEMPALAREVAATA